MAKKCYLLRLTQNDHVKHGGPDVAHSVRRLLCFSALGVS